jgi:hypothetical protein
MFTHMSSTQCNHQHCPHTFPIYLVNDQLQLSICPCSDTLKRQWQQCWYRRPIQIVFPEDVLSHVKTINNHMGRDLKSREDVPALPSPNVAPDFAHHDGNEVLCCSGAKWHHTPAVLVVYGKEPASPYPARVSSNMGHWPWCQLARDAQA